MPRKVALHLCPVFLSPLRFELPNPKPNKLWNDITKWALCFRPRPSSPWRTRGIALDRLSAPELASWKIWCCGWSCWYCLQNALKIASSLAGCGWCSPWSMCMQLLPTKKSNQVWIGRMGMCFQSPSCVLSSFSDNANFLTKTLWTQRAMFSSPPDLCAICSPTSATKSLAAEMHEVHEALASNESNLERAQFQSSIASLQVCSAHCSLIILDMEPV